MPGPCGGANTACSCRPLAVSLSPERMLPLRWGSSQSEVRGLWTPAVRAPWLCHFLGSREGDSPSQPPTVPFRKQDRVPQEAAGAAVLGSNPSDPSLACVFCGDTGQGVLGLQASVYLRTWEHRLSGFSGYIGCLHPPFSLLCVLGEDTAVLCASVSS